VRDVGLKLAPCLGCFLLGLQSSGT